MEVLSMREPFLDKGAGDRWMMADAIQPVAAQGDDWQAVTYSDKLDFGLPPELEAGEPPEARGLARDEVRLMVSYRSDNRVVHTRFRQIGEFLEEGDLLVINTSGTMNAALVASRDDGLLLELHLSTHLPADLWVVEVRIQHGEATAPFYDIRSGEKLKLPAGGEVTLLAPRLDDRSTDVSGTKHRSWNNSNPHPGNSDR